MIPFLLTLLTFLRVIKKMLEDQRFRSLLYIAALTLATGTFFYHEVEGWRWLDSLYFSVITLATVGYGDFTPQTDLGKIFTILYIFLGLGILVSFITPIGEFIVDRRIERVEKRTQEEKESENEFDFSGIIGKLSRGGKT